MKVNMYDPIITLAKTGYRIEGGEWMVFMAVNTYGQIDRKNIDLVFNRMADTAAMWCYAHYEKFRLSRYELAERELSSLSNVPLHSLLLCDQPGLSLGQDSTELIVVPMVGRSLELYLYLFGDTDTDVFYKVHWNIIKKWALYHDILYNGLTNIASSYISREAMLRYIELVNFVYFDCDPVVTRLDHETWLLPTGPYGKHNVYTLSDPSDGKIIYVGYTSNPKKRYSSHINAQDNPMLADEISRIKYEYGMLPKMDIIYTSTNKKDAMDYEREAIHQLQKEYNLTNRITY